MEAGFPTQAQSSDEGSDRDVGWRGKDLDVKRNIVATHLKPGAEEFLLHPFLVLQGRVTADVLDWQLTPIMRVTYHAGAAAISMCGAVARQHGVCA